MGILILPFLLGASISFIMSIVILYKVISQKALKLQHFIFGLALASIIYVLIIMSYVIEKQYWALGPAFTFPTFLFIVPFIMAIITKQSHNRLLGNSSTYIFVSIIVSGLYFLIFNDLTSSVLDKLGLEKYY